MNRRKKRKQLFDIYSENFRVVTQAFKLNVPHQLYVCPLCRRFFNESHLEQSAKNPLTIEHVPPENSGGKDLILTCKECNNNHGAWFDSHLKKMDETEKIISFCENTELKTTLTVDEEVKIGSTIKFSPKKLEIFMDTKRTAPKHQQFSIWLFGT